MEIFAHSDRFVVRQKKEMLEILLNWEANNRYEIYDANGQPICFALEDTGCCERYVNRFIDFFGIIGIIPVEELCVEFYFSIGLKSRIFVRARSRFAALGCQIWFLP